MSLSNITVTYLQDALTSVSAGNELANAVQTGAQLSSDTTTRLQDAMTNVQVASDIQAAIQGTQALSIMDIEYLVWGLASYQAAANFIANVAGGVSPSAFPVMSQLLPIIPNPVVQTKNPSNVSMPSGFSLSVSNVGNTAVLQVQANLPAGSLFPSTGPGSSFLLYNAGNANTYQVWYNVSGGSNTNPTPAGVTGIEVTISSSSTAAQVATLTQAAIAAAVVGMTSSVSTNVVTILVNATIIQVSSPSASPAAGTYSSAQLVSLSSTTAGASIYYTTNGSTPTTSSTPYVGPFSVGVSQTVKALGVKVGFSNSQVSSSAYVISASPGVATQVVFYQQPVGAAQGVNFATMPIVKIEDVTNAVVSTGPDSTALVTLAISSGNGVLSGTISMNAVAGVADFSSAALQISLYGAKILSATKSATSGAGVLVGYSNSFNISNGLAAISLGAAGSYEILSEAGISNTTGTSITGSIAVSPIAHTAITGFTLTLDGSGQFATAPNVSGDVYAADYSAPTPANLTAAVSAMQAAYTDGAGRTSPNFTNIGSGELGGLTLLPGLYKFTTGVTISTNATLSGGPNDVWIFQIPGTLSIAAAKSLILSGGALASNIFWVVAGAVTIAPNAIFEGCVLSSTSIAVETMAAVHGALYAQTAVTLDNNAITPT